MQWRQHVASRAALERGEEEGVPAVDLQEQVDEGVAHAAHTVEKDDRTIESVLSGHGGVKCSRSTCNSLCGSVTRSARRGDGEKHPLFHYEEPDGDLELIVRGDATTFPASA
jgi:hypothetical protein